MIIETLRCQAGHDWQRRQTRGPKPLFCRAHTVAKDARYYRRKSIPARALRNAHWPEYRAFYRAQREDGADHGRAGRRADAKLRRRYPAEYLRAQSCV